MPNVSCTVLGCSNSTYRLKKWRKERCYEHGNTDVVHKFCGCKDGFPLKRIRRRIRQLVIFLLFSRTPVDVMRKLSEFVSE